MQPITYYPVGQATLILSALMDKIQALSCPPSEAQLRVFIDRYLDEWYEIPFVVSIDPGGQLRCTGKDGYMGYEDISAVPEGEHVMEFHRKDDPMARPNPKPRMVTSSVMTIPCPPDPVFDRFMENYANDWLLLGRQEQRTGPSVLDDHLSQAIAKGIGEQIEVVCRQVHDKHVADGGVDLLKDLPSLKTVYSDLDNDETRALFINMNSQTLAVFVCEQAQRVNLQEVEGNTTMERIAAAITKVAAEWPGGQLAKLVEARAGEDHVEILIGGRSIYRIDLDGVEEPNG